MNQILNFLLVLITLMTPLAPLESEAWVATRMRKSNSSAAALKSFFVISYGAFNGNLGGLSGANSKCLLDLQGNNWKGKLEATLNVSTVKAFLCDSSTCNNLQPNRTYHFAYSGDANYGGATFTTNSVGAGPGNSNDWSGPTYFTNGLYYYWTNRARGSDPLYWPLTSAGSSNNCNNWTSGTGGFQGYAGVPGASNADRWNDNIPSSCSSNYYLICLVEPP